MDQGETKLLNKRGYNRFEIDTLATLIREGNLERPIIVTNLCSRGVGGVINYSTVINEEVIITMTLPIFDKPISRKAKIVWCKEIKKDYCQVGLDFGPYNLVVLS